MTFSLRNQLRAEVFSHVLNAEGEGPIEEVEDILHDADWGTWPEGQKPHFMLRLLRAAIKQGGEAGEIAGTWLNVAATQNADVQLEKIADLQAPKRDETIHILRSVS